MKEIPLTQGKVAIVDDDDYEKVNLYKWYAHKNRYKYYARRKLYGQNKWIFMHWFILNLDMHDYPVDHINGNGCDNRKSNLRICTHSQNRSNSQRELKRNCSSKYKGVYCIGENKWVSKIRFNKKQYHLGTYSKEEDAFLAYKKAADKYHGEYANY